MPVELETERLRLRMPRLDDVESLLDFVGDAEVMNPIGSEPGGADMALEHLERWIARWDANDMGPFLLVLPESGRIVGRVGPLVWDARTWQNSTLADAGDDAEVELGWAVAREHWGHGYATEAARAVRQWVYADRGVQRLISLIDPANTRSERVASKLGARPVDTVQVPSGPARRWVHPR
jgi:RimJ/RimL family protein N-acetyltransferase